MADILPFEPRPKKAKPSSRKSADKMRDEARRGDTLCRQGHHSWRIVTEQKFDVKQGRLVTVFECRHCQKRKVKAL